MKNEGENKWLADNSNMVGFFKVSLGMVHIITPKF
jgi:hypothetical protein